jgi:hypothetical protein
VTAVVVVVADVRAAATRENARLVVGDKEKDRTASMVVVLPQHNSSSSCRRLHTVKMVVADVVAAVAVLRMRHGIASYAILLRCCRSLHRPFYISIYLYILI